MRNVLNRYERISGQAINFNKSNVLFSPSTSAQDRLEVCQVLQVSEVSEPGKYLGMPMNVGRNKVLVFQFLIDRVKKKVQSWSNKTLSKSGKCLLLKTVAQAIPNFLMNLFLIPTEVGEAIEVQMNGFLWGNGRIVRG